MRPKATDIDLYIVQFSPETRRLLRKVRATIKKAAPQASEKISYAIPTFALRGNLVHFAGYARHIGLYPGAAAVRAFARDLEVGGYKWAKGSIQFPLDQPIPYALITRIVKFCVKARLAEDK